MSTHRARLARRAAASLLLQAAAAAPLAAQEPLVWRVSASASPVFESWSLGSWIPQATAGAPVGVVGASQLTVPFAVELPLGSVWSVSVAGAYASGVVRLVRADSASRSDRFALSGPTDVGVEVTGRLRGEQVVVTAGATLPTGASALEREQLAAFQVLAAPALGFQAPAAGAGSAGFASLVLARELAGWAWALSTTVEAHGAYSPLAGVLPDSVSLRLRPGPSATVALGASGPLGAHEMTASLSADVYGADRLRYSAGGTADARSDARLGPALAARWRLDLAAPRFRELTLELADTYHLPVRDASGARIAGTAGHQAEALASGVLGLTRHVGALVAVEGRAGTRLPVGTSLANFGYRTVLLRLGLDATAGGLTVQPFAALQRGSLRTGYAPLSMSGWTAGVRLETRL